jgi:hypothetical protein
MPRLSPRELSRLACRFKRERKNVWDRERKHYSQVRNLSEAIDAALGLRPNDVIPDHQRRVGRVALTLARRHLLQRKASLTAARNFCELHNVIERVSEHVPRFGKLAVYDVAWRLGVYLKKKPDLVYLHAGTKEGALALGLGGNKAELNAFPAALQIMPPAQLEDFLCICRAALRGAISYSAACREIKLSCSRTGSIC